MSLTALGTAALALASIPQVNAKPVAQVNAKPVEVAQGSAEDLGVMSINLKDIVKPQVGVQAQTQAAGTPNEAGIGGDHCIDCDLRIKTSVFEAGSGVMG